MNNSEDESNNNKNDSKKKKSGKPLHVEEYSSNWEAYLKKAKLNNRSRPSKKRHPEISQTSFSSLMPIPNSHTG